MKKKDPTFEERLARLQAIVTTLESGNAPRCIRKALPMPPHAGNSWNRQGTTSGAAPKVRLRLSACPKKTNRHRTAHASHSP